MNTIKLKTSIKCGAWVDTISPHLNKSDKIKTWSVDLADHDRILTAEVADGTSPQEVIDAIEEAGYSATEVR